MRASIARVVLAALAALAACSGGGATGPMAGHGHPIGDVPLLEGSVKIQPAGWCGGARPPTEYQPPGPTPAANAAVIVRAGAENSDAAPVTTITTGADGRFRAALTEGTYCLVLDDKRERPKAGQYTEPSCLDEYWKQCDAVAHVPATGPTDIVRSTTCFGPCYRGPMPP